MSFLIYQILTFSGLHITPDHGRDSFIFRTNRISLLSQRHECTKYKLLYDFDGKIPRFNRLCFNSIALKYRFFYVS